MTFSLSSPISQQGKHGRSDSTKRDDCDKCAIGTASKEVNLTTPCPTCPTGRAQEGEGNTACRNCLAGKFKEENSDDEIICTNCGAGQYTDRSNAPKCKACKLGETTLIMGAATCSKCDLGQYGSTNGTCTRCSSGKYQDGKGEYQCKNCEKDTYLNEEGKSSKADCKDCRSDKSTGAATSNKDSSSCLCKRTLYYRNASDGTCSQCPAGADCSHKDGLRLNEIVAINGFWRPHPTSEIFSAFFFSPSSSFFNPHAPSCTTDTCSSSLYTLFAIIFLPSLPSQVIAVKATAAQTKIF